MRNPVRKHLAAAIVLCAATALWAAQTQPAISAPAKTGFVSRTTQAMHYREAQQAAQEAARQKQEAEQAKAEASAQQQVLAVEADRARQAAAQSDVLRQQAEKEKQELRARLLQQLNTVLSTRDSARGLIANMSDDCLRAAALNC
jgi:molecular chaperone GrpE (heat shock protein)